MQTFILIDGFLFLLIGIVVMITPSPQPGLTKKVNEEDLLPFSQTRRLLAAMFMASALLLLAVGFMSNETSVHRAVGMARILSFILVIVINANQYKSGRWKAGPLLVLMTIFSVMSLVYAYLLYRNFTN